ncbi:MAG: hypothetical protein M0C28_13400 [Candidatus Moduliflexus flocculans]|nr:hypothetical protein [Candidatus Moduliflexus flocculans]
MDVSKDRALHARGPSAAARRVGADRDVRHGRRPRAPDRARSCPFTAEEFWAHLPGGARTSVHLAAVPAAGAPVHGTRNSTPRWSRLMALRAAGQRRAREAARSRRRSASRSRPSSHLRGDGADRGPRWRKHRDDLPALFITSQVDDASSARRRPGARRGAVHHEG